MAVYFALYAPGQSQPADFISIDQEMCHHFGVAVDPDKWYSNWYNTVGFALALGHSWPKIKEFFPDQAPVIDWLAAHYSPDSWAGR